jgi:hypothetical protein
VAGVDDLPKNCGNAFLARPATSAIAGIVARGVAAFVINTSSVSPAGVAVRAIILTIAITLLTVGVVCHLADPQEDGFATCRPKVCGIGSVLALTAK